MNAFSILVYRPWVCEVVYEALPALVHIQPRSQHLFYMSFEVVMGPVVVHDQLGHVCGFLAQLSYITTNRFYFYKLTNEAV